MRNSHNFNTARVALGPVVVLALSWTLSTSLFADLTCKWAGTIACEIHVASASVVKEQSTPDSRTQR